jgi:hypothetical protein
MIPKFNIDLELDPQTKILPPDLQNITMVRVLEKHQKRACTRRTRTLHIQPSSQKHQASSQQSLQFNQGNT